MHMKESKGMKRILIAALALATVQPVAAEDLQQLYQQAQANDPQIRAARATRQAAGEAAPIARAGLLPSLSASASATHTDVDARGGSASDNQYDTGTGALSLSQPLYRRDRLIRVDQADAQIAQAEANLQTAEQSLRLRVAQAYFGVLAAQDNLGFAKAEQTAIARQLDQAKRRFEVGLIAITGVHEAQARFDQSRANVITARNQLDNQLEVLREIVGGEFGALNGLEAELPLSMPSPADLAHWSGVALENNPAVIAARQAVDVARQEVEVQRSGHYPTLDLVGSYSLSRGGSTSSDTNTAAVGLQLAVPLYSGGATSASTRQSRFNLQAARETLEQQRRAVARQVRDAYRGMEASISRVAALKAGTVSSQSALEATEAGFEVGTRTLVDVLNAQSELFRAQRDYAQARYDYVLNLLALKQAAGIVSDQDMAEVNGWLQ